MFKKFRSMLWMFPGKDGPSLDKFLISSHHNNKTPGTQDKEAEVRPEKKFYPHKRRHPRYPVEGKNVHAHLFFSEEVIFHDLSVSGVCVQTIKDIPVGSRYILKIQGDPPLSLLCRVIWKHKKEDNETMFQGYLAGLSFLSPTFEEIVRLKDFMRMYGEPDHRTVGDSYASGALRFYIRDGEKALLNRQEVLNVKTISLCGILVESSRQMNVDEKYFMKIHLSSDVNPIRIRGRIASIVASSDSTRPAYNIGVEFLDIEVPDKALFEKFIHNI